MEELDKEILNTFKKVEMNIPLLDVVRQIPKYAKFLKELCTHKRRIMDKEVVNMGRNVSSLIKKPTVRMSQKCKDPDMFSVPCIIGSTKFYNAMLDLGASINVMPLSVFTSLYLFLLHFILDLLSLLVWSFNWPTVAQLTLQVC